MYISLIVSVTLCTLISDSITINNPCLLHEFLVVIA